jgi:hypothetical protein
MRNKQGGRDEDEGGGLDRQNRQAHGQIDYKSKAGSRCTYALALTHTFRRMATHKPLQVSNLFLGHLNGRKREKTKTRKPNFGSTSAKESEAIDIFFYF